MIPAQKFLPCVACLLLAGCLGRVGPDYQPPSTPDIARFAAANDAAAFLSDPTPTQWWRVLNDARLNRLVERALESNNDVKVAQANLRAARAALAAQRGGLFPQLNAGAAYARTRPAAAAQGVSAVAADADSFDAGFDASWELDVFGRVSRSVEAATASAAAAEARLDDMRVSIAADTARAYVDLRGAQQRLNVARRNAENQKGTYELTVQLSEGGRGSDLDVARARAQYETTLAGIASLEAAEDSARFRLAVLTGDPPSTIDQSAQDYEAPAPEIPRVPETVAIGDPASMLRQRPDIRAAEREVAAATARIGVATADLFPRIDLIGSIGLSALGGDLFNDDAAFRFAAGPSLSWTVFAGGRVRALVEQADAQAAAQLARYDAVVLAALEDAENALSRYSRERIRFGNLTAAADASARAADLAEQRYRGGVDSFLNVLDAQRSLLASEDAAVQSQIATTTQFIAIYKALGLGWSASP
ncbi:MAG: TolC family protein [Rhodospirillaceae bacterium]|nr:TolC family protein [Rhodospirillaceae bacterium]